MSSSALPERPAPAPALRPGAGRRWSARLGILAATAVTAFGAASVITLGTATPARAQGGGVEGTVVNDVEHVLTDAEKAAQDVVQGTEAVLAGVTGG